MLEELKNPEGNVFMERKASTAIWFVVLLVKPGHALARKSGPCCWKSEPSKQYHQQVRLKSCLRTFSAAERTVPNSNGQGFARCCACAQRLVSVPNGIFATDSRSRSLEESVAQWVQL